MTEPSVLDYLKALLRGERPAIPELPRRGDPSRRMRAARAVRPKRATRAGLGIDLARLPWRSVGALALFVAAQWFWAPQTGATAMGASCALLAVGLAVWAQVEGEWRLPEMEATKPEKRALVFRRVPLFLALLFFGLTFLLSGGNRFNFLNVLCWLLALTFVLAAFWQPDPKVPSLRTRWLAFAASRDWGLQISRWAVALALAFALIGFFRFHDLQTAPPEMNSDHAEKLLDVYDIQHGQPAIFFERNSGREPLQFYLTDLMSKLTGNGISFTSLKLSTTVVAFISLAYTYLLGKQLGGRWVGLFALLLTGLGYWPNLLARVGLRFSLYPTFAVPVLFYLLRGLKRGSINDFLLAGIFMGVGLNGYTAFRIMPLVAALALVLFLAHRATPQQRQRALIGFALLALVSLVLFAPLLRYSIDHFSLFGERMLTRLGEAERPYPGSPAAIFAGNVVKALAMFNYSGGEIWLVGLVRRPAFDLVSASLLLLGVCIAAIRYARSRNWEDLFLLLAIPVMMLPSTLSLAFPEENPAMNRASGAWVPALILCALGLDALLHGLRDRIKGPLGLRSAQAGGALILLVAALLNYRLFFNDYVQEYGYYSWNSSEMGTVIADFADTFGTLDSAWVVAYPHWVDTRLVGMEAGNPARDYAIWPDQLANTLAVPAPKLFILKPEDEQGLAALQQLYPQGVLSFHQSQVPTKEFLVYIVANE